MVFLSGKKSSAQGLAKESEQSGELKKVQLSDLGELSAVIDDCFIDTPGRTDLTEQDIELTSEEPVRSWCYRFCSRQREILDSLLMGILELGVTKHVESGHASLIILVVAPAEDPVPVIGYRKLNTVAEVKVYSIPNIKAGMERVRRAPYVTTLELTRECCKCHSLSKSVDAQLSPFQRKAINSH